MGTTMRLAMLVALVANCGGVETAVREPDGGDAGGAGGTTGAAGAGGTGGVACEQGTERCGCYGNDTCNDGLACLSDLCVATGNAGTSGGGAAGSGAGRGGATGSGNTTGQAGTGGAACPSGQTVCSGGACIPASGDGTIAHCGGCGACPAGATVCNNGVCACGGSLMLCGSSCIDITTNKNNCGGCNHPCGGTCSNGVCSSGSGGAGNTTGTGNVSGGGNVSGTSGAGGAAGSGAPNYPTCSALGWNPTNAGACNMTGVQLYKDGHPCGICNTPTRPASIGDCRYASTNSLCVTSCDACAP